MHWIPFTTDSQLQQIIDQSAEKPQVIFKHSTRCSISSMAKSRMEREATPGGIDFYYLDLIAHRALSQKIADTFSITHESPQVLLIKDGRCIYDESHTGITMHDIVEQSGIV